MNTTKNQGGAGEAMKRALDEYRAQLAEPPTESFEQKVARMSRRGYEYNLDSGLFEMTYEGYCRFVNGDVSG